MIVIVIITRLTQYSDLYREANPLSIRPVHREANSLSIRPVVVAPWLRYAALARLPAANLSHVSPLPLAVPSPIYSEPLPTVLRCSRWLPLSPSHSGPGLQVSSWSPAWLIFSTRNDATPGGALAMTREGDAERRCDKRVATMPLRRGRKTSPARLNKGLRQGVKTTPLVPLPGPCLEVLLWSSAWLIFYTPNSRCHRLIPQNPYPRSSCRPMISTCFLRWLPLPSPPSG